MVLANIASTDPFGRPLRWLAYGGGLILFALLFVIPWHTGKADPDPARLAFSGSSSKPLNWVEWCLLQNRSGRLNLRHRENPKAQLPMVRLDNPVRQFVVDVVDDGKVRILRAYSQTGEPFTEREAQALDSCLNGEALALADYRRE